VIIAHDTPEFTISLYEAVFQKEREQQYPVVDAFEEKMGFAIDRERLEAAARVLACPLKKNTPNWQHGRVLYAAARKRLQGQIDVAMLDIGTAKGFSALCLLWALRDTDILGTVTSVDVIDPMARVARNTVSEVTGLKTLAETLEPWPESQAIKFKQREGVEELSDGLSRIHVGFIDGKHDGRIVAVEGYLLSLRQQAGDLAIFDDVHFPDIKKEVKKLQAKYDIEWIKILPSREYAVGVRRG